VIKLIKPPHLISGDTIGVVSPSFPIPTDQASEYYQQFQDGLNEIRKMGFEAKIGANCGKVHWWRGGTAKERAEDINEMYSDKNIKAIIAHDGGHAAIDTLEYLDYELMTRNPKPFIGFSDITNILSAIYTKTGIMGIHGSLSTYNFGHWWKKISSEEKEEEKNKLLGLLTSNNSEIIYRSTPNWNWWRKGSAAGNLFGGNLSALVSLIGTPYYPKLEDLKNMILFWEIDNIPSYRIHRALFQLKYAGVFENISGMIIGRLSKIRPTVCEGFGMKEPNMEELIMDAVKDYNFPVLSGFEFGHEGLNLPLPIGSKAKLDSENSSLILYISS
jgi:muramoyltetrapeptide carboxypeptidase